MSDEVTVEQWVAVRKESGLKIDPATAEVDWIYALTLDPYGVEQVPEEYWCVGREYFGRSAGSDFGSGLAICPEDP